MKNRFLPLVGVVVLSVFIALILFATQVFSTVYFKKGVLIGTLVNAFEPTRIVFYVFGTFLFICLSIILAYLFLKRKNYGIHNKNAFDTIKVMFFVLTVIFITMIISFTKRNPTPLAITSWIVFGFGLLSVINLGNFVYKIYRK